MTWIVLACLVFAHVRAFTSYQEYIPNGGIVQRNGVPWPASGHRDPFDVDREAPELDFGYDFRNASKGNRTWNRILCEMDSDGDGISNGMELGDPNCVWKFGDIPSRTWDISHPGYSDSRPAGSGQPNATASHTYVPLLASQVTNVTSSPKYVVCNGQMGYNWTFSGLDTANPMFHLTLDSYNTSFYQSFGVGPSFMNGPIIACIVVSSTAKCWEFDGKIYGMYPRTPTFTILSWSKTGVNTSITLKMPMSKMDILPYVQQRVMYAVGRYDGALKYPRVHRGTDARGSESLNLFSVVNGGVAPSGYQIPRPARPTDRLAPSILLQSGATPSFTSPEVWEVNRKMAIQWVLYPSSMLSSSSRRHSTDMDMISFMSDDPEYYKDKMSPSSAALADRRRQAASSNVSRDIIEMNLTSTGDWYVSIGISPKLMDGPMITCYVDPVTAAVSCTHWLGVGLNIVTMAPFAHIVGSTVRTGGGWTVTIRFFASDFNIADTAQRQRAIYATGPYSYSNVPLQHTVEDRTENPIDIRAGRVPQISEFYFNVAVILTACVIFVILLSAAIFSFKGMVLPASGYRYWELFVCGIFGALVAIFISLCYLDYVENSRSNPVPRAFGDGAIFCIWFILYPVPKKINWLTIPTGTSYERLIDYHVWMSWLLWIFSTIHFIWELVIFLPITAEADFWRWDSVAGLTGPFTPLAGLFAWLCLSLIMLVSGIPKFRRLPGCYNFFLIMHLLWVPFIIFACLHYPKLVFALIPPLVALLADYAWRFFTACGVTISNVVIHPCGITEIVLKGIAGAENSDPGSFAFIAFPTIGLYVSHPYSFSWCRGDEVTFYIKSFGPWSTAVHTAAKEGKLKVGDAVRFSGPVGSLQVPLDTVDEVLIIAAGIGITPMLRLFECMKMPKYKNVQRVRFVWVAQNWYEITPFIAHVHEAVEAAREPSHPFALEVELYLDMVEEEQTKKDMELADKKLVELLPVQPLSHKRPNFNKEIQEMDQFPHKTMGVYACGPKIVGWLVQQAVEKAPSNVKLHEEVFEF